MWRQRIIGRKAGVAAALAVAVALGARPAARAEAPDIVKQIPAEAQLFVAIPSLGGLSGKVALLNEQLELNQPQMADVLGMARGMLGLHQGVDDEGGAALVVLEAPLPQPGGPPPQPKGVVLLPVTDYGAFLGNFGVQGAGAEAITPIELVGKPAFVKRVGDYAVLADRQEVLAAYRAPEGDNGFESQAGYFGAQALVGADALVYVDLAKLGPALQGLVQMGLVQAQQEMAQQRARLQQQQQDQQGQQGPGGPEVDPAMLDLAESMIRMYGQVAQAFLRDGQAVVAGLDVDSEGVGVTATAQFKEGSPLASDFANAQPRTLTLNRLPVRPFLMVSAMDMDALPLKRWFTAFAEALPAEHAMGALLRASMATFEVSGDEVQQAWYGPAAEGPPSPFNTVTVYATDQPRELVKRNREVFELMDGLSFGPGMKYQSSYTADAMQVAGHSVDQYALRFQMPPEAMAELGPLAMIFGQGFNGYVTSTEGAVVQTGGADPSLIRSAIETADGGGELDAEPGIAAARRKLPSYRVMETYVGVGTLMEMGGQMAAMFMPQAGAIEVPADLPPIAGSLSAYSGGAAARLHVPMDLMLAVRDVVRQFQQPGGRQPEAGQEPSGVGQGPGGRTQEGGQAAALNHRPASAALLKLDDQTFQSRVIGSQRPVLVAFWARWSGPAAAQDQIINALADQYEGRALVGRVDVDRHPRLGQAYGVESVPTVMLFKGGEVAKTFEGLTPKEKLEAALDEALGR